MPHAPPEAAVAVFALVYLGMILGGLPFLQLDRTGVALLGAIALLALDAVSIEEAARAVHLPTLVLLFAFMVMSAQMRLGGFYGWVTRGLAALPLSPPALLGALIVAVALLAAVFSNDVVCLAVAPVLIDACRARRVNPLPFLLGARVRGQRRLGRDAHRQSAEHAGGRDAAAFVRAATRCRRRCRSRWASRPRGP